ncbi:SRPBCC family protein [Streptomyces actuosus]|uniref:SRPBCC family protein n=1 Tax=Streptomyces actuosus TaxID=1885 RepID=A0ABS2VKN1_STRAS|nr:SRPBCC family protein [Streptomyces actuosus]MBN0043653.1 SRPBCC family protein [Streptomyces actuosus]
MSQQPECGRRRGARLLPLTLCAASVLYARRLRPRLLSWGATPDEAAADYPGDELFPDADTASTMATTLPAPPEEVWPWLAQMGADRAGWYSWDRLDHCGEPSAERIEPDWQQLEEGQRLTATRDGNAWFTVARLEPNRTLVLRSDLRLPGGRSFDPQYDAVPRARADGIWGFHLRPTPDGGTRLVVRTRGRSHPHPLTRLFDVLFGEPAHFVMQTRQFHNLRHRVGAAA